MSTPILIVDAFTGEPFRGNPAGVCLLDGPRPDDWMQSVASEMNLSETAFPVPRADGGFDLRWFTPKTEVPLCGHATLASAHALWESGRLPARREAVFHSKSGRLAARPSGDHIEMDFPAIGSEPAPLPDPLRRALGVTPLRSALGADVGERNWIVELPSEADVRAVRPDFAFLRTIHQGVIVTARGAGSYDFVSRYFASAWGIDEDPVTGSAHCGLAPYWAAQLGKSAMTGFQCSTRGGVVGVELRGDRVALRGQAVTVLRGELVALTSVFGWPDPIVE